MKRRFDLSVTPEDYLGGVVVHIGYAEAYTITNQGPVDVLMVVYTDEPDPLRLPVMRESRHPIAAGDREHRGEIQEEPREVAALWDEIDKSLKCASRRRGWNLVLAFNHATGKKHHGASRVVVTAVYASEADARAARGTKTSLVS